MSDRPDDRDAEYDRRVEQHSSPEEVELALAMTQRVARECQAMPPEIVNADFSTVLDWVMRRCEAIFDEGTPEAIEVACFGFDRLLWMAASTRKVPERRSSRQDLRVAAAVGRDAFWWAMMHAAGPRA